MTFYPSTVNITSKSTTFLAPFQEYHYFCERLSRGAENSAEIIPIEPDTDNAVAGIRYKLIMIEPLFRATSARIRGFIHTGLSQEQFSVLITYYY